MEEDHFKIDTFYFKANEEDHFPQAMCWYGIVVAVTINPTISCCVNIKSNGDV